MNGHAEPTAGHATPESKAEGIRAGADTEAKAFTMDIPDFIRMDGLKKGSGPAEAKRCRVGRTGSLSSDSESAASSAPPSPRKDEAREDGDGKMEDDQEIQGAGRRLDSLRMDPNNSPPRRHVRFCLVPNEIPVRTQSSCERREDRSEGKNSQTNSEPGVGGTSMEHTSMDHDGISKCAQTAEKSAETNKKQFEWGDAGMGDAGLDSCSDDEELGAVGKESEELYDPDMDDLDQKFVDNRRRRHLPGYSSFLKNGPPKPKRARKASGAEKEAGAGAASSGANGSGWKAYVAPNGYEYYHNGESGETTWVKPAGFAGDDAAMAGPEVGSDAILSCPCCFAIVCLDCQRHHRFHHQYRAVFVQNCEVLRGEALQASAPDGVGEAPESLAPVRCKTCQAEIGVMDSEEVFHFFDVIPSNG